MTSQTKLKEPLTLINTGVYAIVCLISEKVYVGTLLAKEKRQRNKLNELA